MVRTLALITGASSGIGAAYARLLASDCDLVLVARRADRLNALAGELGEAGAAVEILPADLGTRDGLAAVTGRLAAGDVRLLVNNAGRAGFARLVDVNPAEVEHQLTLNAVAAIRLAHAALPGMLAADKGTIVNVASLLAFSAGQDIPHLRPRALYTTAKAAIVAFTRILADELTGTAVRTQVVCPGVVATEFDGGFGLEVPFAMSAHDVAQASLAGLALGESFCAPGLEGQVNALDALLAAETALIAGGNRPSPAARYQSAERRTAP